MKKRVIIHGVRGQKELKMKKETENQKKLRSELETYCKYFKERKKSNPEEDHSKMWVIFAYNYHYELNDWGSATYCLDHIGDKYLKEQFVEDLKEALKHKERSMRRLNSGLEPELYDEQQAEFFICGTGILPLLSNRTIYDTLMEILKNTDLKINLGPKLGVVEQ